MYCADSDSKIEEEKKMADCFDCVHSQMKGGSLTCSRTGNTVTDKDSVCGQFADSKKTPVCEECANYRAGVFCRWSKKGKCKLKGETRKNDDEACTSFYRW